MNLTLFKRSVCSLLTLSMIAAQPVLATDAQPPQSKANQIINEVTAEEQANLDALIEEFKGLSWAEKAELHRNALVQLEEFEQAIQSAESSMEKWSYLDDDPERAQAIERTYRISSSSLAIGTYAFATLIISLGTLGATETGMKIFSYALRPVAAKLASRLTQGTNRIHAFMGKRFIGRTILATTIGSMFLMGFGLVGGFRLQKEFVYISSGGRDILLEKVAEMKAKHQRLQVAMDAMADAEDEMIKVK